MKRLTFGFALVAAALLMVVACKSPNPHGGSNQDDPNDPWSVLGTDVG